MSINLANWVIPPEEIIVLVPGMGERTAILSRYLHERFPPANVVDVIMPRRTLLEMRNRAIVDIVLGQMKRYQHFVWLDDDLKPDIRTDAMFEQAGDIVGCMFDTPNKAAWQRPDDVHLSALRFSRKVVEVMSPPYYRDEYDQTYMNRTRCECQWFRDRAKELGFTIARAGWAEHGKEGRWC